MESSGAGFRFSGSAAGGEQGMGESLKILTDVLAGGGTKLRWCPGLMCPGLESQRNQYRNPAHLSKKELSRYLRRSPGGSSIGGDNQGYDSRP